MGQMPDDVTIMNWRGQAASLDFFSDLGNEQVIAGFYDRVGQGYSQAQAEVLMAHAFRRTRPDVHHLGRELRRPGSLRRRRQGSLGLLHGSIPEPGSLALLILSAPLAFRRRCRTERHIRRCAVGSGT